MIVTTGGTKYKYKNLLQIWAKGGTNSIKEIPRFSLNVGQIKKYIKIRHGICQFFYTSA